MVDLDQVLIHRIGRLMRADNVHRVRTWLFLYEKSAPGSQDRLQYETLLREYVVTENAIIAARVMRELQGRSQKPRARPMMR